MKEMKIHKAKGQTMQYFLIPLTTLVSLLSLFVITRLTGNRQISSLSAYDYVNSITLGSIAAEMATADDHHFWYTFIAMVIYGIFTFFCAVVTDKSIRLRRLLIGSPIVLMEHGKLYRSRFRHAHLDTEEFTALLRSMGYFDIAQIDSAVLETNGKLSVLPKAEQRPLTPGDMQLTVPAAAMTCTFIHDGVLCEDALKRCGRDRIWLDRQLSSAGIGSIKDVFLASLHPDGTAAFFTVAVPSGETVL